MSGVPKQTRFTTLNQTIVCIILSVGITTSIFPGIADASTGLFSSRKTVLSSSAPGASANYDINITAATSNSGIESFRLQVCTSPLQGTTCNAPSGFGWGTTISTQTLNGSAFGHPYSGTPSGSDYLVTNALGNSINSGDSVRFVIQGNTNPTAANTEFYVRVTSCTDTTCNVSSPYTNNIDFGAMAVSTAQQLSETANVQEALTFCVGTTNTSSCGSMTGSAVALISGGSSTNPMTSTATSYGNAYMDCSSNAASGYVIAYTATPFTDTTSDTINAASPTGTAVNSGGTEEFGLNLVSNSTFGSLSSGPYGADVNPPGATISAGYNMANTIAYNTSGSAQVASTTGATATVNSEYTLTYGANVSSTTHAGTYTATQTFIATGTF